MNADGKASRTVRISLEIAEQLERLGTMSDTYDSILQKLLYMGARLIGDDIPKVMRSEDVTEILELMRVSSFVGDPGASFILHLIPMDLSTESFEVINSFRTVLNGCLNLPSLEDKPRPKATVLELVVDEGETKSHGYIITPVNFSGWMSNMGLGLHSYAFLNSFTSGYAGTGPEIQRIVQETIKEKKDLVKHVVHNVNSLASLNGLFYERGPNVNIQFPGFEIPLEGFDFDDRFIRHTVE